MTLAITAAVAFGAAIALGIYHQFVEMVQLFKLDDPKMVAETLKWLPDSQLARIYSRGGMTRHQWKEMKRQLMQEIDKSLGTKNGRGAATAL